jgi:hypothetical protein
MKTVIITNNCLKFHSGSEMITLDLCNYFVGKGCNVYLCAFGIGNPLSKYLNTKVKQIDLNKRQIPIKQADLVIGHHSNVIDKVLQTISCKTVIQNSLSIYSGIESYSKYATRLFANSQETKALKQPNVSLPIEVFVNSCNQEYFKQTKQLSKQINKIAIITNHQWYKGIKQPKINIIGGWNAKFVNAQLLMQYDVVITIGRTVQQCLCLGIPVYCYDHFGGPGYITKENLEFNEWFNFSGRQKLGSYAEVKQHNFAKIFADIYNNYEIVCKQQTELVNIARKRYNFERNLDKVVNI